jgi:cell surface protein SprA
MTGEIWLDEMRVTDVERETATAYRASLSLQMADLGSISMDIQRDDADFHNVQQQFGSGKNTVKTSVSGNLNLNKFLPERWGLSLPLSASYRESEDKPKYISGTDIQVDNLPVSLRDTLDAIISTNQSFNWNLSLSKRSKSDFWLTKYTLDALSLKVGASNSSGSSSTSLKQTADKLDGNLSYNLNLGKDFTLQPFGFLGFLPWVGDDLEEATLSYLPSKVGFTANVAENRTFNQNRVANSNPSQKHTLSLNRNFNVDWSPVKSVNASYRARYNNNLDSLKNRKQEIIKNADFGHLGTFGEDYNLSWSPKLGEKLQPQFGYQSNFSATDKIDPGQAGLDLSVTSRTSGSISLKLTDMIDKVYKPEDTKKVETPAAGRGTRGRAAAPKITPKDEQTEETIEEQQAEEKDERLELRDILDFSYKTIDRISPISVQVSRNHRTSNPRQIVRADTFYTDIQTGEIDTVIFRELAINQVGYDYRLGFLEQPGFGLHPAVTNAINVGEDINLSLRTGINFTKNLTSNLNMTFTESQSESGRSQGIVATSTSDYLPSGAFIGIPKDELVSLGRSGFVIPSFSLRYSGLNNIEWLKKYVNSASLDVDYNGKRTLRSEGGRSTAEEYSMQINPRLSVTGKKQISGSLSMRLSRTINNTISAGSNSTSNQSYATDVNANVSYQHRGGLRLKVPFMEERQLENNIDFRLEMSYQATQQWKGLYDTSTVAFEEGRFDKNISITPTIGYSFTDKVSGNIGYKFQVFDNKGQGRRDVSDFSFGVNIQIKG